MSNRKRPYTSGVKAPVGSQANIVMPARALEYEEGKGFDKNDRHLHQITEFSPIFRNIGETNSFLMRTLNSNFHQKITGCFSELRSKRATDIQFLGVSLGTSDPTGISHEGSANLNFPLLIDGLVSTINTSNDNINPGTWLTIEEKQETYTIPAPPVAPGGQPQQAAQTAQRRIPNSRMRSHVNGGAALVPQPYGKRMTESHPDSNLITICRFNPANNNHTVIIGRATNRSRPGEQLNFICKPTAVLR